MRRILDAVKNVERAIQNQTEPEYGAEERERNEKPPTDKPKEVRAVVSYDDQTIRNTKAEDKRKQATQDSIKHAAWSTFIAASFYALIAVCQWRVQINALKVDQRAWIGLDKPMVAEKLNYPGPRFTWSGPDGITHPIDTPNPLIHTTVVLKNFGKTPAFDVAVNVWSGPQEMLDVNSNLQCKLSENASSGKALKEQPPRKGASWPTFGKTIFPGQEDTEPEDIAGGDIPRLFVVGCIAYRDAFNARHKTRFCYKSPQVLVTDPAMKDGDAFKQCNQYNDAN